MKVLEKITEAVAKAMLYVAGAAVFAMMMVTVIDVVLRYFRMPLPGTYEMVGQFGAIAVAFALAHTTATRGHVSVSIIVSRFPYRVQHGFDMVTSLLGLGLFCVATYEMFGKAQHYREAGNTTMTLNLPLYPVVYCITLALAAVSLVLFTDFLRYLGRTTGKWR